MDSSAPEPAPADADPRSIRHARPQRDPRRERYRDVDAHHDRHGLDPTATAERLVDPVHRYALDG